MCFFNTAGPCEPDIHFALDFDRRPDAPPIHERTRIETTEQGGRVALLRA